MTLYQGYVATLINLTLTYVRTTFPFQGNRGEKKIKERDPKERLYNWRVRGRPLIKGKERGGGKEGRESVVRHSRAIAIDHPQVVKYRDALYGALRVP